MISKKITVTHICEYFLSRVSKVTNEIYEEWCKKRIKNKDFSIICSTCIGGVIYHRLGMKFLSPTINLWMNQKDFIKLIKNLQYYMDQELSFIKSEYNYPVAQLNREITIFFNHALNDEEARETWNKRKVRINYNNLYIIMYDRDGITKEDIESLKDIQCRKLIVLSENHYPDIEYVKSIRKGLAKPFVNYILEGYTKAIQENIAMIVGMCLFVGLNYLGQRFFVFKNENGK